MAEKVAESGSVRRFDQSLGRESASPDRPLGTRVPGFVPPPRPEGLVLRGRHVTVEPLVAAHAPALFAAFEGDPGMWDYMPIGPFETPASLAAWLSDAETSADPVFYAFTPSGAPPAGFGSFLRIAPEAGSIEVGFLAFSATLRGTIAATEAMYLMMRWAFEAGYRRYEWKCNALNRASRRAAQRLGLSFEGVFRQHMIVKGRNRDTAWFAATDGDWPALRAAFETWLDPANFDDAGRQKTRLGDLTRHVLVHSDPSRP
jgi:RimJ/RimL family protein N-acetyltransferase